MTIVGKPVPHESSQAHTTGEALFTDDLASRLPGVLCAWPVQSSVARGRIRRIDRAPALAVPGVVAVLTAEDVPGDNHIGPGEPLLPGRAHEVGYHGQAVAWVLAETEDSARRGTKAASVTCEPLPAILSLDQAIAENSFHTEPLRLRRDAGRSALPTAPHRLMGELFLGGQEHFYLETQAAFALPDEAGGVLVHSSTQHPAETQEVVARVLGRARNQVVVQCLRMGGAFGGKEVQASRFAAVAALGAFRTGRPTKVRLPRSLDMIMTGKRHPFLGRFDVGFDHDGRLVALALELYSDGGFSLDLSEPVMLRAMFHADNAYFVPHLEVVGRVCRTNRTSQTAFRGFGGPQGMAMIEEVIDRVARNLSLPPHVVRERNLYRPGQTTHYGQEVKDAERIQRIWQDLLCESRFETRRAAIAAWNAESPHRKRGIAITPVKFGISFTTTFFNQAGALVLIYQDGSIQVNHGGTEMGQGLHTKIQQIAAETLGVNLCDVRVMPTRTDKVPNSSATAASSGSDLNGAAVKAACDELRQRLAAVAARELVVPASDVAFAEGRVVSLAHPDRALTFPELARRAYLARVPLFAVGTCQTPGLHFDRAKGQGAPFHYFAYGAAVCEVEVCGFTGAYQLRRVDVLQDVGDSLSPLIDRGQIEGGFIQGLGWLTREELVWDREGRVATTGASTYKLPGLGDVPEELHVRLLPRASEPGVVYGSKAVGEPPLMLALSAREALRDAVAAFGSPAPRLVELASPATPEAVFWAISRVRSSSTVDCQH